MSDHGLPDLLQVDRDLLSEALKALRSPSAAPQGPLLYLELVSSRLRRDGAKDTRDNRAQALEAVLRGLAWTGLCAARGAVNGSRPDMESDRFPEGPKADVAAGSKHRLQWSAVWYRFFSPTAPSIDALMHACAIERTTYWRRSKEGTDQLLADLLAAERVARKGLAGPDVPPAPLADQAQRARAEAILARVKLRLGEGGGDALELDAGERRLILGQSWDSLDLYRLRQALLWSDERFKLDERFVDLALLIDLGEDASTERWQVQERRYGSLEAALADQPDPCFVVLGAPGSGKSTLLRHHELGLMLDGLRGETGRISFFVPLSRYGSRDSEVAPPPPLTWLASEWTASHPGLPPLPELLAKQEVTLLLDAVNEMPHRDAAEYQLRVGRWRALVEDLASRLPGNRVIFSCRSLDYSAPLSSTIRAVPQLRIEALDDDGVQAFLASYCPKQAKRVWEELKDQPQLALLRTPFLLRMLAQQAERDRRPPTGRAALFSSFVRGALRNEVQNDNPRFAAGKLISSRERNRIVATAKWIRPFDLPAQGLFPPLSDLAYAMQDQRGSVEAAQIRVSYDEALDRLDEALAIDHAEAVLLGGCDLGILDQDPGSDDVLFRHQLLQEYFAARKLAREPRADLAAGEWRADHISPSVEELIQTLAPAEPLPPLPTTGWEETMLLAGAMATDQDRFVETLAEANLPLAGRCAAQPESKVSDAAKEKLRWALVHRSRDPEADLRARIAAGEALGELGDPRFKRCVSAEGVEYLLPPMVRVEGGRYWVGSDEGRYPEVLPRHEVVVEDFWIGQFPVTNAEYACFIEAKGYYDARWWTGDAYLWWKGYGTDEADARQEREWYEIFRADRSRLHQLHESGLMLPAQHARWCRLLELSTSAFLQQIEADHPGGRKVQPRYWQGAWSSHANHPVTGVGYYEACAYAMWLSHATDRVYNLVSCRQRLAVGSMVTLSGSQTVGNTANVRLRRLCPVGVFSHAISSGEVSDFFGNTIDWVSDPHVQSNTEASQDESAAMSEVCHKKVGYSWSSNSASEMLKQSLPGQRTRDAGFRLAMEQDTNTIAIHGTPSQEQERIRQ